MNITSVRIRKTYQDTRLRALVSITVDGDLAVHDIKVIEGPERLFVAMPSRKDDNGVFRDIAHPITAEARTTIETHILTAYQEYLDAMPQNGGGAQSSTHQSPAQQATLPEIPEESESGE